MEEKLQIILRRVWTKIRYCINLYMVSSMFKPKRASSMRGLKMATKGKYESEYVGCFTVAAIFLEHLPVDIASLNKMKDMFLSTSYCRFIMEFLRQRERERIRYKTTYTQYLKTCIHFQEHMSKFHIVSLSFIGLFYWIKDAVNFFKTSIFTLP